MKLGQVEKQPGELEVYSIDYSDDLDEGDNIASATASVVPNDLVITSVLVADPRVRIWCDGGIDGVRYKITVVALTEDGRRLEDEVIVKVKEE